jgi:hypothetical protein
MKSGKLSAEQEQRLQTLYEQTNPRHLREEIYQGLAQLWSQCSSPESFAGLNQRVENGKGMAQSCC